MEYNTLIKKRYSVRKYQELSVPEDLLDKVLDAGRLTPTARNAQSQRYYVVRSLEGLNRFKTITPSWFNPPVMIIMLYEKLPEEDIKSGRREFGEVNASLASMQMMLMAANLGLGTCWIGSYDESRVRALFDIPNELEIVGLMSLGYEAADSEPRSSHEEKYPLEHFVKYV